MAYAFEVKDEGDWVVGKEEDVVDDLTVAGLDEVNCNFCRVDVGKPLAKKGLPFLAEEEHQSGVACGGVDGAERHNVESELLTVRAGKAKFVAV